MESEKPKYNVFQNTLYIMRRYARESRRAVAVALLQAPLGVAIQLLSILLPSVVVGCLERGVSPALLLLSTAGVVALGALAGAVDKLCGGYLIGRLVYLRKQFAGDILFKKFDLDYAIAEHPRTRELGERANRFAAHHYGGGEYTLRAVSGLATNLLGLIVYSAMATRLNIWMFAGLILVSALDYVAAWRFNRYALRIRERLIRIFTRETYLSGQCADFAAGKDIRIYGIAGWFRRLGGELVRDISAYGRACERRRFLAALIGAALVLVRDGWAYLYLVARVAAGGLAIADFVLYFGVIAGYSGWVNRIAGNLIELNRCSLECCDFRALVEMPDRQNRGPGAPLPGADELPPEISFENVRFTYPGADAPALDIPALRIERGQKLAVVGRNGAGKTTFIKLLTGLYLPDEGRIALGGRDASLFNRDEYYGLFTAVFQDFTFLPGTVAENVALGKGEEIDRARVEHCLAAAGFSDKVAVLPHGMDTPMVKAVSDEAIELSGGEQQRLILARALYKDAPVLALDEPTAALDPIAESDMYEKYAAFAERRTSVFISHRLASTRFCDRILFLEEGRIAEDGTHDELMARGGKYRAMFDIQSHYYRKEAKQDG